MKFHLLAATALVCATGSIMSMDQKGRLNFLLNHEWQIKGNSAENMGYEVEPSDFLGKKITEAVPLNDDDKYAITAALTKAAQNQKTEKVAYTLHNKHFSAKVTPIIKEDQKCNFFLKVKEDCAK